MQIDLNNSENKIALLIDADNISVKYADCIFDELNKYFTISNMPIASSQYWNSIHGRTEGQADMDEEGKQTMRTLARNMTFLMKSIELGKEKYGLPKMEDKIMTNFIK